MALTIRNTDTIDKGLEKIMLHENINTKSKAITHAVNNHMSLKQQLSSSYTLIQQQRDEINRLKNVSSAFINAFKALKDISK